MAVSLSVVQENTKFCSAREFTATFACMDMTKVQLWQDQGKWRAYLQDYPDQQVQGESFEELQFKLSQLCRELTSGKLPSVRKVA